MLYTLIINLSECKCDSYVKERFQRSNNYTLFFILFIAYHVIDFHYSIGYNNYTRLMKRGLIIAT